MMTLSATWITASRVATCYTLGAMLAFTVLYVSRGRWWKHPLGWSIAGERLAFVLVLALLGAQSFWTFSLATAEDFLESEVILLFLAGTWLVFGTIVLFTVQQRRRRRGEGDS